MDSLLDGNEPSMNEIVSEANRRTREAEKSGIRPGGDLERQEEPGEKPLKERKYPESKKMYEGQPKDGPQYSNSPELTGNYDNLPAGTHLVRNHISGAKILLQKGYRGPDGFRKCLESNHRDLRFADIKNKDLSGAKLNGGNFANSNMLRVNFKGVKAERANFEGSELYGCDFSSADLHGASFRNVDLSYCSLRGANPRGADLRGATLPSGKEMENSDMTGAKMNDSE